VVLRVAGVNPLEKRSQAGLVAFGDVGGTLSGELSDAVSFLTRLVGRDEVGRFTSDDVTCLNG
jgi:hypothetical protein